MLRKIALAAAAIAAFAATAADRVGIAEPEAGSSFSKEDALAIWDELEASFHSKEYTLVSRAALKQMMVEIGLSTTSDLLDMNDAQKAKLGRVKGVKYLVVPSLRKLGSRITLSLKTLDASTGEIDQDRTATLKATSIDEIADKLEVTLEDMLRDDKAGTTVAKSARSCAILAPRIAMVSAPSYLEGDFNTWLQSALLANGVQLANLADVSRFQKANLTAMTDRYYAVLGRELRVKYLIETEITDFSITDMPWASPETGVSGHDYYGRFRARMKVIDANTGALRDVCPVMWDKLVARVVDGQVPAMITVYAEQMIAGAVNEVVMPRLVQIPGIK